MNLVKLTYYVVGQEMALYLNNEIDYMREHMLLNSYLLLFVIILYLLKLIDDNILNKIIISLYNEKNNILSKSQNNNEWSIDKKYTNIKSAENIKGFSETIRQSKIIEKTSSLFLKPLPKESKNLRSKYNKEFIAWLAGIIDGDGYIQVITINGVKKLKTIEVKLHNRDIRILTRILNNLHMGRIYRYKNNNYSKWIVSTKEEMREVLEILNGLIRIKVKSFKESPHWGGFLIRRLWINRYRLYRS